LVDALNASGKDLIFYGSRDFAKIRIHTEHAERVFSVIAKFGVISAAKSLEIRQDIAVREKKPIALVADTTCDLSDEYIESSDIYFVPIKIQAEDRVYTDKLNIIPEEFYDIMTASPGLPKTSQPSLMDFQRVYENLLGDYQEIISVQLSSHLSGTYQTALQAAKSVAPGRIAVVDSKNLSVGLGLIMIEGINGLKENISRDALLRRLEYAIDNTNIHVGIPTLKYLIKGGRITKAKGLVAKILNINPILGINREGRLETIGKTFGFQSIERKVLDIAFARISRISSNQGVPGPPSSHRERASVSFAVVHSNARQLAERVSQKITEKTGEKPEMVMNASPVLGAHAGPGAVAVAILKHE
jgi:DegV family protein with EDD domain